MWYNILLVGVMIMIKLKIYKINGKVEVKIVERVEVKLDNIKIRLSATTI